MHTLAANGVGIDGAIPERLGELRTLQRLSLRGNTIRALPPSIGGLPLLEEIDVSGNALASLPPSLWSLPALRVLCADPHVDDDRLVPQAEVLAEADLVVIAAPHSAYRDLTFQQPVVDLWNLTGRGVLI